MSQLITSAELQNRNLHELQALYCSVQQELTRTTPGSADRRNALASLENIQRAITIRRAQQCPPAPRF